MDHKVKLQSCDGVSFILDKNVAAQIPLLKPVLLITETKAKDEALAAIPPLDKVTGKVLGKVIDWIKQQQFLIDAGGKPSYGFSEWDENFFNVSQDIINDLIFVAIYLELQNLLESAWHYRKRL